MRRTKYDRPTKGIRGWTEARNGEPMPVGESERLKRRRKMRSHGADTIHFDHVRCCGHQRGDHDVTPTGYECRRCSCKTETLRKD